MADTQTQAQQSDFLRTLERRFDQTKALHPNQSWASVAAALEKQPDKLAILLRMEDTGGEPNVVRDSQHPSSIVFMDCSAESPAGRRSLCYDQAALAARKSHPPKSSAQQMAQEIGIALLSQAQYAALQALGEFDRKTSSWIQTPDAVRSLGGALFCDWRYGQVFTYHNGADSYYGSRGFRGYVIV